MHNLQWNDVRRLLAAGRYYHAGALAAALGFDSVYGHISRGNVRLSRDRMRAESEYAAGHAAASYSLLTGGREPWEGGAINNVHG